MITKNISKKFAVIFAIGIFALAVASAMQYHSADLNENYMIEQNELDRVIEFYENGSYHCSSSSVDGYASGTGNTNCAKHDSDYIVEDWSIDDSELLRLIQLYNADHYIVDEDGEDGFKPIFEEEDDGDDGDDGDDDERTLPFPKRFHDADTNRDGVIDVSELLRITQFFNSYGYHCESGTEDGYAPGPGNQNCDEHDADNNPQDWLINIDELERVRDLYLAGEYTDCGDFTIDGFCTPEEYEDYLEEKDDDDRDFDDDNGDDFYNQNDEIYYLHVLEQNQIKNQKVIPVIVEESSVSDRENRLSTENLLWILVIINVVLFLIMLVIIFFLRI